MLSFHAIYPILSMKLRRKEMGLWCQATRIAVCLLGSSNQVSARVFEMHLLLFWKVLRVVLSLCMLESRIAYARCYLSLSCTCVATRAYVEWSNYMSKLSFRRMSDIAALLPISYMSEDSILAKHYVPYYFCSLLCI